MKILVTGAAGFIGSSLIKALLAQKHEVIGLDCINSYYDMSLKYARLAEAGIPQAGITDNRKLASTTYPTYHFIRLNLTDRAHMETLFDTEQFEVVVNLAAQAGVRYSIENPYAYVESNVLGFLNILENCRHHPVKHLIYASSSSIYGQSDHVPYAETDVTDAPVSLYAATKKTDELMAHSYSKLFGIPTTGVRFFTVYGPWGRPDMAPFLFMKSILNGDPIKVFNHGKLSRDFTYIDDIVSGLMCMLEQPSTQAVPYRIYNIGNSAPVELLDFIAAIEKVTGRKAMMQMTEMQPGDVYCTYADTTHLQHDFGYKPSVSIEEGLLRFYNWYKAFYGRDRVMEREGAKSIVNTCNSLVY
ncbi:NAD-dependent epimerase/dehydratase family protein [Bacteroides reticulotermitis]|uniref:NAD-dependent epimerase/dehydratase family protein n=1 Tax=Bacteroides reticulotermitis TaxID=1133319 RepID=UPI003A8954B6